MGKLNKSLFSSSSGEWETPQPLFNVLDKYFHFTIDVAASKKNHKCSTYYTKEMDALKVDWGSMNWCNPPYGKGLQQWIFKAGIEAANGRSTIMLLPARTDTKWFTILTKATTAVFLFRGRLTFGTKSGKKEKSTNAPFPSMLAFFGVSHVQIREIAKQLAGVICVFDNDYEAKEKQAAVGSDQKADGQTGKSDQVKSAQA